MKAIIMCPLCGTEGEYDDPRYNNGYYDFSGKLDPKHIFNICNYCKDIIKEDRYLTEEDLESPEDKNPDY